MAKRQKLKAHINVPTSHAPSIPLRYAEEARRLAGELLVEAREHPSTLEASGTLALAVLLEQAAAGQLEPAQEFSFLKGLAEKKTPAPIQKMEVASKTDMRVLIADAIEQNSDIMKAAMAKAIADRAAIRERLKLTSAMELSEMSGESSENSKSELRNNSDPDSATGSRLKTKNALPLPPLEIDKDAERRVKESTVSPWRRRAAK